ncbi:MAG: WD40 repeat domain-containing protein [Rubrobacter sp.]|nr:WD40 repeat domain-containing protein [Rubrobacter sp.]
MPRDKVAAKAGGLGTLWRASLDDYVNDLAWSSDGRTVAAADVSGPISIFDASTGEVSRRLSGHGFGTTSLSWNNRGILASAGQDGKVRLWDVGSGEGKELDGGSQWVEKVAFSPDGKFIVSSAAKRIRMWKRSGELLWESGDHGSTVSDVEWKPGSSRDLVSSAYGGLSLWKPGSPKPTRRFEWQGSTLKVAWSPNGKYIAIGDQDSTVHFWIVSHGMDLQMWGYATKVRELAWDSASRYLATGGGEAITVWDCGGKGPEGSRPLTLEAHTEFVNALAYQRRGNHLLSGGNDGLAALWEPGRTESPLALSPLESAVSTLAFSPDDRKAAVGCEDGSVWMMEVS